MSDRLRLITEDGQTERGERDGRQEKEERNEELRRGWGAAAVAVAGRSQNQARTGILGAGERETPKDRRQREESEDGREESGLEIRYENTRKLRDKERAGDQRRGGEREG